MIVIVIADASDRALDPRADDRDRATVPPAAADASDRRRAVSDRSSAPAAAVASARPRAASDRMRSAARRGIASAALAASAAPVASGPRAADRPPLADARPPLAAAADRANDRPCPRGNDPDRPSAQMTETDDEALHAHARARDIS